MKTEHRFALLIGCAAMSLASSAWAQPTVERPPGLPQLTVVADHGDRPARPYFVAIKGSGIEEDEGYVSNVGQAMPPTSAYGEQDMLPVESERLTPGSVASRRVDLPAGFTPIFLVGDDVLSRRWLMQRSSALRDMHAVGLVVQVKSQEALDALRNAAQGLELRPVSGDGLAERLGLRHYPY